MFLPSWSLMSVLAKLVEATSLGDLEGLAGCRQLFSPEADEVLSKSCKVIMLHSQAGKVGLLCVAETLGGSCCRFLRKHKWMPSILRRKGSPRHELVELLREQPPGAHDLTGR